MENLLGVLLVIILLIFIMWQCILIPEKIERNIEKEVLEVVGQVICIRKLNRNIYLVEYIRDNIYTRRNIKSNILGSIKWI